MEYRYILIDKLNKTVKMINSESCQAVTEDKHGIRFNDNLKLEWNGQEDDFKNLSKKYQKFRRTL